MFFAGAVIVKTDFDLCDCFLEYGEVTAEMAMLLAFVLFGALLSSLAGSIPLVPALLFALLVLFVARPVAIGLVLRRTVVSKRARTFHRLVRSAWLASLLFGLLVVLQGFRERSGCWRSRDRRHHLGYSPRRVRDAADRRLRAGGRQGDSPRGTEATATGLFGGEYEDIPRVTPEELAAALAGPTPPIVLDVRTSSATGRGDPGIPGSVRALAK